MSVSANEAKQVAHAFYDSYNAGDLEASFAAYIHPDLVNHALGGAFDRDGWKEFEKSFIAAFDDVTMTIFDQVAEGDKVATRFALSGTQRAEFAGQPSLGKSASLTATAVDRVEGGKIVEHWNELDFSGFLRALAEEA